MIVTTRCCRRLAWVFGMAWMALAFGGCASAPPAPREITLAAIVVDSQRVATPGEAGWVQVVRNGHAVEARPGATLLAGDWVTTDSRATAVVRYPSGTEVYMRPDTRGRVGSFTDLVGEIFAKIRGAFAIQTSFIEAGAQGTAFSVRGEPQGQYSVVVFDGTVDVSSLSRSWRPVSLRAGMMCGGPPQATPVPMRAPPPELARTRAWVERVESLVPAPRPAGSQVGPALAIAGLIAIIAASQDDHDHGGTPAAPTGLKPGSTSAQRPDIAQRCRPLALSWQAVRGARNYVVTLRPQYAERGAHAPQRFDAEDNHLTLAQGVYGLIEWRVQARDANGRLGPSSASAYLECRR